MFIAVGPPTFTGLALIGFGNALPIVEGHGYFAGNEVAIKILQTGFDFIAIFLWTLGCWFFCITLLAVLAGARKMSFHLIWWALVFPNVAFVIATGRIGEQLGSEGIMWVSSIMAIFLVAAWVFVFILNVRAILRRDIMMPGKDEDKGKCYLRIALSSLRWALMRSSECPTNDDEKHGVMVPDYRVEEMA